MEIVNSKLISITRASELSGVSTKTIWTWVSKKMLTLEPGVSPARVRLADLERIDPTIKARRQPEHGGKPALYTKQNPTFNRSPGS